MNTGVLLLALLLIGDKPTLLYEGERFLSVKLPRTLLDDEATRRRLFSGLTLSVNLESHLSGASGKRTDYSLITVRYEVWEERIVVGLIEPGDQVSHHTFANMEEFFSWLGQHEVRLMQVHLEDYPFKLKVTCRVLPYTTQEAEQTREWFSQRLQVARAAERGLSGGEGISAPAPSSVFELLMSSGIRERAILSFRWRWSLPLERAP